MRNPENMFATVFAMLLDTKTGVLTFANAGHEPPLLLGRERSFLKMENGMALGLFANIISYSGADNVSFSCTRMGQVYSVTFSDNGVPFDPVNAYIYEKDFEELDTGGMGIKLAKMNSSDMVYACIDNRNVLTLKFDIRE